MLLLPLALLPLLQAVLPDVVATMLPPAVSSLKDVDFFTFECAPPLDAVELAAEVALPSLDMELATPLCCLASCCCLFSSFDEWIVFLSSDLLVKEAKILLVMLCAVEVQGLLLLPVGE